MRFRTRTVEVEAFQWHPSRQEKMRQWLASHSFGDYAISLKTLRIKARERREQLPAGWILAEPNDWVVRQADGFMEIITAAAFAAQFEEVAA